MDGRNRRNPHLRHHGEMTRALLTEWSTWRIDCFTRRCIRKSIVARLDSRRRLGTAVSDHGNHQVKPSSEDAIAVDPSADTESESMRTGGGPTNQPEDAAGGMTRSRKAGSPRLPQCLVWSWQSRTYGLPRVASWNPTGVGHACGRIFVIALLSRSRARSHIGAERMGIVRFSCTPYGARLRQLSKLVCACSRDTRQLRDRGAGR
jgi:hypothetical protein